MSSVAPPIDGAPTPPAGPTTPAVHLPWIDGARIVAVLAVVTIHVTSYLFESYDHLQIGAWVVADVVFSATRWPVTVLVMVSGYLMLGRPDEPPLTFYRRRLRRILIPLVAWSVVYWVYLEATRPAARDLPWFVTAFLDGGTYFHLYFLYVIAGLWLITPFLRLIVAKGGMTLTLAIAGTIGYAVAQRFLLELHLARGSNGLSLFIPYIGFYLLGYSLGHRAITRGRVAIAAAVTAIAALVAAAISLLLEARLDGRWVSWVQAYFGLAGVIESIGVFVLLRAVPDAWVDNAAVRWGGSVAFGVYLISPLVAGVLGPITAFPHEPLGAVFYIVVRVVVLAGLSAVIVGLMRRLPLARAIV